MVWVRQGIDGHRAESVFTGCPGGVCSVSHVRPDWREEEESHTCDRGDNLTQAAAAASGGKGCRDLGFSGLRGIHEFILTLDS